MSAPAATKKVARSASKKKTTPSKDAPKAKRGDGQRVSNNFKLQRSERTDKVFSFQKYSILVSNSHIDNFF